MEPHYQFQYLRVRELWPESDEELSHYAVLVRFPGQDDVPEPLRGVLTAMARSVQSLEVAVSSNPNTILQVCLLRTDLFRGCEIEQIRDIRAISWSTEGQDIFVCRDRARLIETLAEALLSYEYQRRSLITSDRERREQLEQIADRLAQESAAYAHQHWRNPRLRAESRKQGKLPPAQFEDYVVPYITQLKQALPPLEPFPNTQKIATATRLGLLSRLFVAFRQYCPSKDEEYTEDALYHAMAGILVQFGLEKPGPLKTVTDRIYKFLTRHLPSLKTRRARHRR